MSSSDGAVDWAHGPWLSSLEANLPPGLEVSILLKEKQGGSEAINRTRYRLHRGRSRRGQIGRGAGVLVLTTRYQWNWLKIWGLLA
jgi:hypothetical protein